MEGKKSSISQIYYNTREGFQASARQFERAARKTEIGDILANDRRSNSIKFNITQACSRKFTYLLRGNPIATQVV